MGNTAHIIPSVLFGATQYHVTKLFVMVEWMKEGVKERTCAFQEKLTILEIIVLANALQFALIMKSSARERILSNGQQERDVRPLIFVWTEELE